MLVGVPKEIKDNEFRVGLTPGSVAELVHHGHKVLVETIGRRRSPASPTKNMSPPARRWSTSRRTSSPAPT